MSKQAWILTFTGREIDLENPSPEDVDALDIAHALSQLPRFTGHTFQHYSIAQHCTVGSILAEIIYPEYKWLPHMFQLHDAPEAYVGDVSSPLKSLLPEYRTIEGRHKVAVETAFNTDGLDSPQVKLIDLRMLATERHRYMAPGGTPWSVAAKRFTLAEFVEVMANRWPKKPRESFAIVWDQLWTPWPAEIAEEKYLDRLWKLGL